MMKKGCDILLEFGADPNVIAYDGSTSTPLRQIFKRLTKIRKPSIPPQEEKNTVNIAEKEDVLISMIRHLLSKGADPDIGRLDEEHLLVTAINSGSVKVVKLILQEVTDILEESGLAKFAIRALCSKTGIKIILMPDKLTEICSKLCIIFNKRTAHSQVYICQNYFVFISRSAHFIDYHTPNV